MMPIEKFYKTVAKKAGTHWTVVAAVFKAYTMLAEEQLIDGNPIQLPKIGTFSVKYRKGITARNINKNETVKIPPSYKLHFHYTKRFRKLISYSPFLQK